MPAIGAGISQFASAPTYTEPDSHGATTQLNMARHQEKSMATIQRTKPGRNAAPRHPASSQNELRTRPRVLALAVSAALLPTVWALPAYAAGPIAPNTVWTNVVVKTGGTVGTVGNNQDIKTNTTSSIVEATSANIGKDASVYVDQPTASSLSLIRVTGPGQSVWDGRFGSDGRIFFTNPDGLLISRGASVDVGSLFATSLSIQDQDFLAGRYQFTNAGNAGSVVNQGAINIITANGYAALAGPQVRNDGVIIARAGTVVLAAGNQVSLDMVGDRLISVRVDQAAVNAYAINTNRIEADGGHVLLTARSANALLDTVVNNTGIIRANSIIERNGEIILDGGSAGVVANSGTLQAAGVDAGTTGGTVKMLGQYVGLMNGSSINASGDAGGGTVLVGGNYQGQGTEFRSTATYMDKDATITADAVTTGNGGKVILWSDGFTNVHGTIYARGGAQSGDGGLIETSGHHILDARGVRGGAGAAHGQGGLWLFDPDSNVLIDGNVTTPWLAPRLMRRRPIRPIFSIRTSEIY
jgi:filamentous hemagglutinin family protein